MVQLTSISGCLIGLDPVIMGIVFLAAGTSVPDALASMIVARQGFANMAIANALGSNVFDIFLGLGIPWVAAGAFFGHATVINTAGVTVGIAILAMVVVVFVLVLVANKWQMNKQIGAAFFVLYGVYLTYQLVVATCIYPPIAPLNCVA